ncbi:hypothetical protein BDM02DRAFT_3114697 [Thelephora ganbajun]|uniref:Uncharacterized protein n=1 Tax=Thelephora ganbajun TaxID=370292 RepID=A0ACB6ZHW9_THEGA|nr:hypothetical protein BDM02DRAFT_3114697 [Thelephora ganbajun]
MNAPHVLDDLEPLIYVVEYLLRGCLPWGHLVGSQDYSALSELQESWVPEEPSLREFFRYTRDRQEDDPVDYKRLRELLFRASEPDE